MRIARFLDRLAALTVAVTSTTLSAMAQTAAEAAGKNAPKTMTTTIFYVALAMSFACLALYVYLAMQDAKIRRLEATRGGRALESMGATGDLAEKFQKAGFASSALACSVLFLLIGTMIALAIEEVKLTKLIVP